MSSRSHPIKPLTVSVESRHPHVQNTGILLRHGEATPDNHLRPLWLLLTAWPTTTQRQTKSIAVQRHYPTDAPSQARSAVPWPRSVHTHRRAACMARRRNSAGLPRWYSFSRSNPTVMLSSRITALSVKQTLQENFLVYYHWKPEVIEVCLLMLVLEKHEKRTKTPTTFLSR
jgi:hypothetical protein